MAGPTPPFSTSVAAVRTISGIVHLKGAIATTGTNPVPFTLPAQPAREAGPIERERMRLISSLWICYVQPRAAWST